MPQIRRALISVSDKRGLIPFAMELRAMNVEIISTGGTHSALKEHSIDVIPVSKVTNFPEILDGRVKTLHPNIHAGLLAITDNPLHQKQLHELGIEGIDLVVVNLYPFEQTIARQDPPIPSGSDGPGGVPLNDALEQIDIGGPAMIRAAAKNFRHKAVIVDPDRYEPILQEMKCNGGSISEATCFSLAKEVFHHTSAYDSVIANYLDHANRVAEKLPDIFHLSYKREEDLRYGENPHQRASLYGNFNSLFQKLHGKELSYNNIVDSTSAAMLAWEFDEPTVAIIKHTNPCGVGSADSLAEAYARAFATDSTSAFGGVVAVNRPLDMKTAEHINEVFTEVIVAPGFQSDVLEFLKKKKDRRVIRVATDLRALDQPDIRSVPGGLLVQRADRARVRREELRVVTRRAPSEHEWDSMMFGWRVAKHVKSNAIVYATPGRTIGIGAGQMSRVDSVKIAGIKARQAGLELKGTSVASDAFFPFADGLLEAVNAGSTGVIQPGGSVRDEEIIKAADDHSVTMVFTGVRHFKH